MLLRSMILIILTRSLRALPYLLSVQLTSENLYILNPFSLISHSVIATLHSKRYSCSHSPPLPLSSSSLLHHAILFALMLTLAFALTLGLALVLAFAHSLALTLALALALAC
jgi:hypothetical protein